MFEKKYYRHKDRLADVLALIQVLAFDEEAHRSVNGLNSELQGKPKSAKSWKDIASEHPEFFRYNKNRYDEAQKKNMGDEEHVISLIARHVKLKNNSRLFDTVSPDITKKFFETAIQLHDIQNDRANRWKVWLPLLVAIVTVLSSFYVQYRSNENQTSLKHYEVELKPKQEAYANFMKAISQAYFSSVSQDSKQMVYSLDQAESSFYIYEPFLSSFDRTRIWDQQQQFSGLCYSILKSDSVRVNIEKRSASFLWYKNFFRTNLYNGLFTSEKEHH